MKRFFKPTKRTMAALAVLVALGLLAGCSGDRNVVSPDPDITKAAPARPQGTGTLQLSLADGPIAFEDVVLVLRGISARRASDDALDGWYGIDFDPVEYHLQDLGAGVGALLSQVELPAGHYEEIRLLLADGSRIVIGGEEFDLFVPSGQTSGIKLEHEFDIVEGGTYSATLEFDVENSIRRTGRDRYMLQPVITVQEITAAGSIYGVTYPAEAQAVVWTVTAAADTVTSVADPVTGAFSLDGLPAGSYGVHFDATVEGPWMSITLVGVVVLDGQDTYLGTVNLLIPN